MMKKKRTMMMVIMMRMMVVPLRKQSFFWPVQYLVGAGGGFSTLPGWRRDVQGLEPVPVILGLRPRQAADR
jgi:hypothetical protein